MLEFFRVILYQPLLNLLVLFYNLIPGEQLWLAIICLTIIVKLILFPLNRLALKGQKSMQELQSKLVEIRKKYPNDKARQAQETMALYKENKVNPFASCLPLLIQFPILIAVFQVFRTGLGSSNLPLYSFVQDPGLMNTLAFGVLELSKPSLFLAILAGLLQYIQTKMLPVLSGKKVMAKEAQDENKVSALNQQMKVMMPLFTVFIGMTLPSGLMIYWATSLIITIIEQRIIFHLGKKN